MNIKSAPMRLVHAELHTKPWKRGFSKGTNCTRHLNSRCQFRNNLATLSKELKDQSKVEGLFLFIDKYILSHKLLPMTNKTNLTHNSLYWTYDSMKKTWLLKKVLFLFFICYLAGPRLTLCHLQGYSLIH